DGKTAIVAIRRRCSFVGICFTEEHMTRLYQRLESVVFADMQTPDSVLFEPGLLAVLGKKQNKRKAVPKGKSQGKKPKKNEAKEEEDENEDEEDGDDEEGDDDLGDPEEDQEDAEMEDDDEENDEEEDDDEDEPPKKSRGRGRGRGGRGRGKGGRGDGGKPQPMKGGGRGGKKPKAGHLQLLCSMLFACASHMHYV
ncbi:Gyltl1b, partial [Symbiodinium necroappetens]